MKIELDRLQNPKASSESKKMGLGNSIPDTQRDISEQKAEVSGQFSWYKLLCHILQSSAGHPKKINTTSEDNNLEVHLLEKVPKYLESSLTYDVTKQRERYTVYKLVVRFEDRSYFLFRR